MTIKLSLIPVLLIPLYELWKTRILLRQSFAIILFSSIVFLPWVARNAILTGYLVFPFVELDIFKFNWKVPRILVQLLTVNIIGSARNPYDWNSEHQIQLASMPLQQWLPIWYPTLPSPDLYLLIGILVGVILFIVLIALNRQWRIQIYRFALIYIVGIAGSVFWLFQAPAPRFGYGFLVVLLLLLYAPLIIWIIGLLKFPSEWFGLVTQSILAITLVITIAQFPLSPWKNYLSSIEPFPNPQVTSKKVGSQNIFLPATGDQCWYEPFPCTKRKEAGLQMRGPNLENGFYISGK